MKLVPFGNKLLNYTQHKKNPLNYYLRVGSLVTLESTLKLNLKTTNQV